MLVVPKEDDFLFREINVWLPPLGRILLIALLLLITGPVRSCECGFLLDASGLFLHGVTSLLLVTFPSLVLLGLLID